jgi:hypothetical protein
VLKAKSAITPQQDGRGEAAALNVGLNEKDPGTLDLV